MEKPAEKPAEKPENRMAIMACGKCGKAGHNAKTCGQPGAKRTSPVSRKSARRAESPQHSGNIPGTVAKPTLTVERTQRTVATRIKALQAQIAAGQAAQRALDAIKAALA